MRNNRKDNRMELFVDILAYIFVENIQRKNTFDFNIFRLCFLENIWATSGEETFGAGFDGEALGDNPPRLDRRHCPLPSISLASQIS